MNTTGIFKRLFRKYIISCLMLAKKHNIRVLFAPRGELCSDAFKKKYKKIPYLLFLRFFKLLDNVTFQSTSEEETLAIAQYLGVNKNKIALLTVVDYAYRKSNFAYLTESYNNVFSRIYIKECKEKKK